MLVVLVPDVQVLSIPDSPSLGMEMAEARHVLFPLRERQAQLAARVVLAEQHIGDGGTGRVTQIPSVYECGNLIDPREGDGGSRLGDDDRLWIRLDELRYKVVGTSRESEGSPVIAFSLPVFIETHDGDDNVSVLGEGDSLSHRLLGVLHWCTTESNSLDATRASDA